MAANCSSVRSHSSMPCSSHTRTASPEISWASRKGTPWRTSHSATSVASAKPCGASSARRSGWNSSVAIIPATAGSSTSSWSIASKTGSLSSCRSRL